ncbi:MAG: tetraacyldisaccharide 4'-kinase [Elusimicrobia bacterium RIFOXYA12_FULL_57_11]|nr:MAG: tetraacyldisaccharide 4'-kinase [Elusimicrobia bacterium RIFOXYA12_FULL_57_11]
MDPEKTRDNLKKSLPGRILLWLMSLLYLAAIAFRKLFYAAGLIKKHRLPVPVICFGNITTGGTGKTSTVVSAARALAAAGRKPAILIRGYKRVAPPGKVTVMARGRDFNPQEAGDEALMLYRMLEPDGVPVLVSCDRLASGLVAVRELGADILLMDDGFQHFALERDADILLINSSAPFLADSVLPLGNLREPVSAVRRASAVILSHCEQAAEETLKTLRGEIRRLNPAAEIFESNHVPEFFLNPVTAKTVPLSALKNRPASVISAIGDPASFEASLTALKLDLKQIWRYPDHHIFTPTELNSARQAAQDLPIITTYKDFVRFPADWQELLPGGILILSVKITFRGDGWNKLMKLISEVKARA